MANRTPTRKRKSWAEEKAKARVRSEGGSYDSALAYFLYETSDGPDYGVEASQSGGSEGGFAGDVNAGVSEVSSGGYDAGSSSGGDSGGSSGGDSGGGGGGE